MIVIVLGRSHLKYESQTVPENETIIYQECLNGQEYGADIIADLNGALKNIINF